MATGAAVHRASAPETPSLSSWPDRPLWVQRRDRSVGRARERSILAKMVPRLFSAALYSVWMRNRESYSTIRTIGQNKSAVSPKTTRGGVSRVGHGNTWTHRAVERRAVVSGPVVSRRGGGGLGCRGVLAHLSRALTPGSTLAAAAAEPKNPRTNINRLRYLATINNHLNPSIFRATLTSVVCRNWFTISVSNNRHSALLQFRVTQKVICNRCRAGSR